jgi:hypothetical protein
MIQTTQKIVGIDPAKPGSDRMVLTCLEKREGTFPPFLIYDFHIGRFVYVPEGCLDVWEEKSDGLQ